MTLNHVITNGAKGRDPQGNIRCADGFTVSVRASSTHYCSPRTDRGPYGAVEVGFPDVRPEPWSEWSLYAEDASEPTQTVYGWVPVEMVQALVKLHGGEYDPDAVITDTLNLNPQFWHSPSEVEVIRYALRSAARVGGVTWTEQENAGAILFTFTGPTRVLDRLRRAFPSTTEN